MARDNDVILSRGTKVVNVGKEFSRFPGGRHKQRAKHSGEEFRQRHLEPYLKEGKTVVVELDDAVSYGSSFLDEAFAGLVRGKVVTANEFGERVVVRSANKLWLHEIQDFVSQASE